MYVEPFDISVWMKVEKKTEGFQVTVNCQFRWYVCCICTSASSHRESECTRKRINWMLISYRLRCVVMLLCSTSMAQLLLCGCTDCFLLLTCSNSPTKGAFLAISRFASMLSFAHLWNIHTHSVVACVQVCVHCLNHCLQTQMPKPQIAMVHKLVLDYLKCQASNFKH